jgi:hypothetical protein
VKDVLAAYRKSYNDLDAASASAIWEGVDERELRRAFSSLSHQNLSFERCDVRVPAGDRAVARCDGVLSYVPKFGDSSAQQRRMTWNGISAAMAILDDRRRDCPLASQPPWRVMSWSSTPGIAPPDTRVGTDHS